MIKFLLGSSAGTSPGAGPSQHRLDVIRPSAGVNVIHVSDSKDVETGWRIRQISIRIAASDDHQPRNALRSQDVQSQRRLAHRTAQSESPDFISSIGPESRWSSSQRELEPPAMATTWKIAAAG